jgi:hypothetical protein
VCPPNRARCVAARHDGSMAPKPLTRREMADLARSLQTLLDSIRQDGMTASTATVYRLEGAMTALEACLANPLNACLTARGRPRPSAVSVHRESVRPTPPHGSSPP